MIRMRALWLLVLAASLGSGAAHADDGEQWHAPFGGSFSANFTIASDYSFAGVSQTKLGPAYQMGLDYKTAEVGGSVPAWLYVSGWAPTSTSR